MTNDHPGLYLFAGTHPDAPDFQRMGNFSARHVSGALVSVSDTDEIWIGIDGIITGIERRPGETDADSVYRLFLNKGIEALRELDGYFALILIEKDKEKAWLISDFMAVRPYYIYSHSGMTIVSPNSSYPGRMGLPVTLNRQILYQMFRINHPIGGRCLASEIVRTRPFSCYRISAGGDIERILPSRIEQIPDSELTLDTAADQMHDIASRSAAAILDHPFARSRELELPLTAGYDSRHLLGELLLLGRPPDRIRHVRVDEADYLPVEAMCRDLGLELSAPRLEEFDLKDLIRRWLHNTSGQVHLHQLYLYGVEPDSGAHPVMGMTAYLSGLLFSYAPLGTPIQYRHYTRTGLGFLFLDRARLAREFREQIDEEYTFFVGEEPFRKIAVDAVNRSPRYAGAVFSDMGDHSAYFPPAADRATWEWFLRVPASLAWRQKARIRLFERHFSQLGSYPTGNGFPLIRLQSKKNHTVISRMVHKLKHRKQSRNPVPSNPHAWLRTYPIFRNLTERVVMESKLCESGHIPCAAVRSLRTAHRLGALNGWALMSLATTEAAYRILILGEDSGSVADWMTS